MLALVAALGVANSHSYAQALACRMLMGFGGSVGLAIAPATISDIFFLHEKGKRMGVFSILLVIAPYVGESDDPPTDHSHLELTLVISGGVAGGSIQQQPNLGWRWSMYISAIIYSGQLVGQIFFGGYLHPSPQRCCSNS